MIQSQIKALKTQLQGGVLPAMATPVHEGSHQINEEAVVELANFLIGAGVRGLFVGGTTGEGILFDSDARQRLHELVITAANSRLPVIIHAGGNTTTETVILARQAQEIGAAAIAIVTPYFYGMDDEALFSYYQTIARAVPDTPLLAYDIPQMAVNGISPSLLARMASKIPSFAGLKCSRPDAQVVRQLIDAAPPESIVLAGNERIASGLLALGANGLISGLATAVPEPFVALTQAFSAGDLPEIQRRQHLINEILNLIPASARIGAIKMILSQRGLAAGPVIPPRAMPPDGWKGWPEIKALLDREPFAA
jgi:dihydrodipicolinate synthase/N-acetylneuraminate lyase